jgi:hypothetical protein
MQMVLFERHGGTEGPAGGQGTMRKGKRGVEDRKFLLFFFFFDEP